MARLIAVSPIGKNGQTVVPAPIRKMFQVGPGQNLVGFYIEGTHVEIAPVTVERSDLEYSEEELDKVEQLSRSKGGKVFKGARAAKNFLKKLYTMRVYYTSSFQRIFKKLEAAQQEDIRSAVSKIIDVYLSGRRTSGLGLKHLRGSVWEARLGLKIRILFTVDRDMLSFVLAGSHDEVRNYLRRL